MQVQLTDENGLAIGPTNPLRTVPKALGLGIGDTIDGADSAVDIPHGMTGEGYLHVGILSGAGPVRVGAAPSATAGGWPLTPGNPSLTQYVAQIELAKVYVPVGTVVAWGAQQ